MQSSPGGGGDELGGSFADMYERRLSTETSPRRVSQSAFAEQELPEDDSSAKRISWRCRKCKYHLLSMDQHGRALPLVVGANGNVLPTMCPRCEEQHTEWAVSTPFNQFGDHENVTGYFTSKELALSPARKLQRTGTLTFDRSTGQKVLQPASSRTKQPKSYICTYCNRRLLRIDSSGNLIPLELDGVGRVAPIRCPGCNREHREWVVGPLLPRPQTQPPTQ